MLAVGFMPILPHLTHMPEIGADVVLADDAYLVGKVQVEGPARFGSSAVARGDQNRISISPRFCIGRGSTIHVEIETETRIGADVWVGTDAVVHASQVGDGTRVEDHGLVLSNSRLGAGSIVAADSLVPEGSTFAENSYISGTPGRRLRDTTREERQQTLEMVARALIKPGENLSQRARAKADDTRD